MDSEKEDFEVEIEASKDNPDGDKKGFWDVVVIDTFDNNKRDPVISGVLYENALELANVRRGMLKGTKSYKRKKS